MSEIGHNSGSKEKKEYVNRMVRLLEDLSEQQSEIRDLVKEAVSKGISGKVLRLLAKEQIDPEKRRKRESFTDEVDQMYAMVGGL